MVGFGASPCGVASEVYKPDDAEAGPFGRGKEQNGGMVLQDGVGPKRCREFCACFTLLFRVPILNGMEDLQACKYP